MTDAVGQHLGTAIYIKEGTENQNFSQNAAALLQGKMNSLRIRGMSSIKQTAGKMQVELEKISISQHILARFILRS